MTFTAKQYHESTTSAGDVTVQQKTVKPLKNVNVITFKLPEQQKISVNKINIHISLTF